MPFNPLPMIYPFTCLTTLQIGSYFNFGDLDLKFGYVECIFSKKVEIIAFLNVKGTILFSLKFSEKLTL